MTRLLLTVAVLVAGTWPVLVAPEAAAEQPRKDRYGDPLPKGAIARLGTIRPRGCQGPMVFSPDGKQLVTVGGASREQAVFWEISTGRRLKMLTVKENVRQFVFSPDGKRLAAVINTGLPNPVWDVASGKEMFTFNGDEAAFSGDGKKLATFSVNSTKTEVRIFDGRTGRQVSEGSLPRPYQSAPSLSPDGRFAAIPLPGKGSLLAVFDVAKRTEVKRLRFALPGRLFTNDFSRDGRLLVAAGGDGYMVWEWSSGKVLRNWEGAFLGTPTFSDDGRRIAWYAVKELADGQGVHSVWVASVETGEPRCLRTRTVDDWPSPTFSPDGKSVAVILEGGTLAILDVRTGRDLLPSDSHLSDIASAVFTADGRQVVTRDSFGGIVWDAQTGRFLRCFSANLPKKETARVTMASLRRRKLLDREGKPAFKENKELIYTVHESPGGRYFAVRAVPVPTHDFFKMRMNKGWLRIWDCTTRRIVMDDAKHGDERIVGFSADERTFVSTTRSSATIHLWENATGRERLRLVGHMPGDLTAEFSLNRHIPGDVTVGFRADGRVLVSGGADMQVFLWDVTSRTPDGVRRPTRHSSEQLRALWKALAGDDATEAYRALWSLVDAPPQTVAWMREHLLPVAPVETRQLSRLIADLDSDEFAVRSKASEELERLGELAETALRAVLAGRPTLECRRRCEGLIEKLSVLSFQRLRAVRAVEVLEHLGTAEARALLEKLRQGAPQARLTQEARVALERFVALPAVAP